MKGFRDENYWMERAQRAEAECERLREGLRIARRHVVDAKEHADDESISPVWQAQCHADLELIDRALATPPPEGEPNPREVKQCRVCGEYPENLSWCDGPFDWCPSRSASHTPEQAEGEPQLCPTCRQSDQPLAIYYICDGCERAWKEVENGHTDNPYAEPSVVETPEQAHGDALDRQHDEQMRASLTASGVPEDNND